MAKPPKFYFLAWRKQPEKMIKNLISTTIVALGIAGAFFVVQQSAGSRRLTPLDSAASNGASADQRGLGENNNLVSGKPFVENLKDANFRGFTQLDSTASNGAGAAKENLTDSLTEGIRNALSQYNPNGTIDMNGQQKIGVPDPEILSENLLASAAQKFNPDSLKPIISEKDLDVSGDNGKESLRNYFNNFNKVINDSAALLSGETLAAAEINPAQFDEFILMYDTAYKNLKAITVPSNLVKIHKQELEQLGAKSAIYRALKNYETDPLFSILASQNLEKFDQDFTALNKEISDFIKKSNI